MRRQRSPEPSGTSRLHHGHARACVTRRQRYPGIPHRDAVSTRTVMHRIYSSKLNVAGSSPVSRSSEIPLAIRDLAVFRGTAPVPHSPRCITPSAEHSRAAPRTRQASTVRAPRSASMNTTVSGASTRPTWTHSVHPSPSGTSSCPHGDAPWPRHQASTATS
jgi:hypothetical protein